MVTALRSGVVRDLRATRGGEVDVQVPGGGLTCLLGIGARLFDERAHTPRLADRARRPWSLTPLRMGPDAPFPSLRWLPEERLRPGEADLALQLIADREITVARVVVEVWKLIRDEDLPLAIVAVHRGFQRDDERSWIDFHDGVNNMAPDQRRQAIEVTVPDPPWMLGGTYMGFFRIDVDLPAWRALPRVQQEVVVGREKLTGCPLGQVRRTPDGSAEPVPDPPFPPPTTRTPAQLEAFRNPSKAGDRLVQSSHIHRSNFNRGTPDTPANNRIYRQGYEFLEVLPDGRLEVGLNFVSFQRTLAQLTNILRLPGWQGDSNFGGPNPAAPGEPDLLLMRLIAGGLYAVPPRADPFPGADLL